MERGYRTHDEAKVAAIALGEGFEVADEGPNVSPRFWIVELPRVGDPVSFAFNGDSYPCGHVTHVTKGTARVVKTDTGETFYRRGNTSRWVKSGGTWSLARGHVDQRNPDF